MKTRDAVLAYQEAQSSDKTTKVIDLDIVDPITALGFEFEATTGTTSNRNNPLHRAITDIELVDGSDVLAKVSFEEAQALQFYKTGKQPQLRLTEDLTSTEVIGCQLLFGRYLYDQEYALNLTSFRNPQLKITWDLAKVRPVDAATAWATGTLKLSAWAKIMEGAGAPGKYLMPKRVDSWTGGSSGDKRRELPLDYIYRMLMLRSYYQGDDVNETITKIKMTCDTDKFVPLERYTKQLDAEMAQLFGNCIVWKQAFAGHDDDIWLPINKEPHCTIQTYGGAQMGKFAQMSYQWSGNLRILRAGTAHTAEAADAVLNLIIEGHALHATLPIPMGDIMRPETWFDPIPYRKIELICTEGADAAEQAIILEQVRPC